MNKVYAKGHDPEALAAALGIADRAARQAAMNALALTGARQLVSPQAGLNVQGESPLPGSPEDLSARTIDSPLVPTITIAAVPSATCQSNSERKAG